MSRKKIALCFPNFSWQEADKFHKWDMFPFALCILASVADDICDIEIIDANKQKMTEVEFSSALSNGRYDMVGISVLMDGFAESGHLAATLARQALPDATIVIGGVYATTNPGEVMENQAVDYVCIGEGEELFPQLLRFLFHGGAFPAKGLAYRENGDTIIQERAPFVEDLDSLPRPSYHLIDLQSYTTSYDRKTVDMPGELPYMPVIMSRGCPQSCSFCQAAIIAGHKVRAMSPERVVDELEYIKNNFHIKSFLFFDENLLAIRSRAKRIFEGMIERKLDMSWGTAVASFRLDLELLELMAKSGCTVINPAVESGSPRVLKEIINKPVNLEHTKKIVKEAKTLSLFTIANFIIGFPGETWEEIRQTLAYAEELDADYVKIFSAIPLRHTRLWERCIESDAFYPGFSPTRISWNQGQVRSKHFDERELTFLRAYEWDRINFSSPEKCAKIAARMQITTDELDDIRKETRKAALSRISRLGDCEPV